MDWYCLLRGQQRGPMDLDRLRLMVQRASLHADDYVWTAAFGDTWRRVRDVPELHRPASAAVVADSGAPAPSPATPLLGQSGRPPQVSRAFSEAWDATTAALFGPVRMARWFGIGFCVWLTSLSGVFFQLTANVGPDLSASELTALRAQAGTPEATAQVLQQLGNKFLDFYRNLPASTWERMALAALVSMLIGAWLRARGDFMLLHRWHRPNDGLAASWRAGGNGAARSVFLFRIVTGLLTLALSGLVGALWFRDFVAAGGAWSDPASLLSPRVLLWATLFSLVLTTGGTLLWLLRQFVQPVMYGRQVGLYAAWRVVADLCARQPVPVAMYVLVVPLAGMAAFVAAAILAICACCLPCILAHVWLVGPYLVTVLYLPFHFFFRGLGISFLRQWRSDLWARE